MAEGWPLQVQYYERFNPSVLQSKPSLDETGSCTFHLYAIRFNVEEIGLDPLQESASNFALLTPKEMDKEVAQMFVNLYLPFQTCVRAQVSECGQATLQAEQVDFTKRFNLWLFDVILGRSPVPSGTATAYKDGPKGYYVLPILATDFGSVELDWHAVKSSLTSGLVFRKKIRFFGGFAKLEETDLGNEPLPAGQIVMRNGRFRVEDLTGAMVTCAHNGMPCYVTETSTHLNGYSSYPHTGGNMTFQTYNDYYVQKCAYDLKYKNQPFLKGCRFLRAANYLKRQSSDPLKGKELSKCCEFLELPPEICILHVGSQGRLCRGAMRLPSVLYSLEMASLAAELRDLIGVPISCLKVLEALTSRACQGELSYESLELLGDSVLKFTGSAYVFLKDSLKSQEDLGAERYQLVRNKTLYSCALICGLYSYVFVEPFAPSLWVAPGPVLIGATKCVEREGKQKAQMVSCRTLADIVEALLGAYLTTGGLELALKAMAWLKVPIVFPTISKAFDLSIFSKSGQINLLNRIDVEQLERKLGYHFKDLGFLAAALDHGPQELSALAFQRMEFLGDGVLDYLITRHLVTSYPELDEGKLNDLKQATINSENYACVAIRHRLHVYLQLVTPVLKEPISQFVKSVCEEGGQAFGISKQCAPKAIGDLLQTLAAAIFLDSGLDVELVWKVHRSLLEPLATPETVTLHPIRQLEILCMNKGWTLRIEAIGNEGAVKAQVSINQLVMGASENEDKKVARRLAAIMALQHISSEGPPFPQHKKPTKVSV